IQTAAKTTKKRSGMDSLTRTPFWDALFFSGLVNPHVVFLVEKHFLGLLSFVKHFQVGHAPLPESQIKGIGSLNDLGGKEPAFEKLLPGDPGNVVLRIENLILGQYLPQFGIINPEKR